LNECSRLADAKLKSICLGNIPIASFESEHLNKITKWAGAEVARADRHLGMIYNIKIVN